MHLPNGGEKNPDARLSDSAVEDDVHTSQNAAR